MLTSLFTTPMAIGHNPFHKLEEDCLVYLNLYETKMYIYFLQKSVQLRYKADFSYTKIFRKLCHSTCELCLKMYICTTAGFTNYNGTLMYLHTVCYINANLRRSIPSEFITVK